MTDKTVRCDECDEPLFTEGEQEEFNDHENVFLFETWKCPNGHEFMRLMSVTPCPTHK